MKTLLRFLVLIVFFLGSLNLGSTDGLDFSVSDMAIIQCKQGVVKSFSIPAQYIGKGGELMVPLVVSVIKDGKTIFEVISLEKEVALPTFREKGEATIIVQLNELIYEEKIDLNLF